jgi:hypothetical protein
MILFEIGIYIGLPIQLADDKIEIEMLFGRDILHQQLTRDFTALH